MTSRPMLLGYIWQTASVTVAESGQRRPRPSGGPTARTGPKDSGYGTAPAHLGDVTQEQRRLARCLLIENKIKKRIESAYL